MGLNCMKKLEFNKELTNLRQGNEPSVIFRKLPETGNNDRYQGSINKKGVDLIESLCPDYNGLQIVFSDSHSIIGFIPLKGKGIKSKFGATQLLKNLNLVVGKKYNLIINTDYTTIDANEYNQ